MRKKNIGTMSKRLLIAGLALIASSASLAAELKIYAGAGLRPAIEKLASQYQQQTGDTLLVEYGGSGQILARYQASGQGDVFIPGSMMYFSKLGTEVDHILPLVSHTPVLGVYKDKANDIRRFEDLTKPGIRVGLGDPQAMALGRTAETILDASGVGAAVRANTIMRAATVKQLAMYLKQGDVDAAIIGRTDAVLNADTIRMIELPASWYQPEVVAAGVLAASKDQAAATRFVDWLSRPDSLAVFTSLGFLAAPANALTAE
ncbi:molybdate ABC transporter substrate-binding protein [Oceanobacter mangrovi]|uniref:molybdate ABC transporter substrate-binding protein n=1 Tax=Oceanobacter mangrovi TaxID=2862510 RepID=UPI001C8D53AC|nr:molybdate ABC transporter substrate-binding protein [Oceanobacter mangrovi]